MYEPALPASPLGAREPAQKRHPARPHPALLGLELRSRLDGELSGWQSLSGSPAISSYRSLQRDIAPEQLVRTFILAFDTPMGRNLPALDTCLDSGCELLLLGPGVDEEVSDARPSWWSLGEMLYAMPVMKG